jgi:hypothetical protein
MVNNREALVGLVGSFASVVARGLPALRAAINGARVGAGKAFNAATVESLGIAVIASDASQKLQAIVPGPLAVAVKSKDGLALRVTALGGVSAGVTESAVAAMSRVPVRQALMGVGKATAQGALAGALVDGALAAFHASKAVKAGEMSTREGAIFTAQRVGRGAAVGGAGVLAAGAASAAVAASGLAVMGAPVVVPLVTMVAVGTVVGRQIDKLLTSPERSLPGHS